MIKLHFSCMNFQSFSFGFFLLLLSVFFKGLFLFQIVISSLKM